MRRMDWRIRTSNYNNNYNYTRIRPRTLTFGCIFSYRRAPRIVENFLFIRDHLEEKKRSAVTKECRILLKGRRYTKGPKVYT